MSKINCTVILSVKNEENNIENCLNSIVDKFEKIIVVDSFSNDNTKLIVSKFGVECVDFHYMPPYPKKRQWALDNLTIITPWVLLLDADEIIGNELFSELSQLSKNENIDGIFIRKKFYFMGKRLKHGGFDFKALLMFRTGSSKFEEISFLDNGYDMEIHERILCKGNLISANHGLEHLDWNSFHHYVNKHNVYASWDSDVRLNKIKSDHIKPNLFGNIQERRRFLKFIVSRLPFEPFVWFVYHYIFRLGFLEGRRGLIASITRSFYIFIIRVKMYETKSFEEFK